MSSRSVCGGWAGSVERGLAIVTFGCATLTHGLTCLFTHTHCRLIGVTDHDLHSQPEGRDRLKETSAIVLSGDLIFKLWVI